jgi:hypothetical protein
MNYHIHENGWTVIIDDFDLKQATQPDINQIAKLLSTNTLVIIKKQKLSVADEIRVIKMFKNPRQFYPETNPDDAGYINCVVPSSENILVRVTGELDENGHPGFAGDVDELQWHCNDPTRQERHPLVWLSGIRGTAGSRTSWNNNIMSYKDLDDSIKEKLKPLKLSIKHLWEDEENTRHVPDLIHTNIAGKVGLFFPFLQITGFQGMSKEESKEIIDPLIDHTTCEKYVYHLDWEDGDITISEQWLGIHKRWEFEGMGNRLLHRAVFDFPDQDYTA